jgi:hypothetical protein
MWTLVAGVEYNNAWCEALVLLASRRQGCAQKILEDSVATPSAGTALPI